MSTAGVVFIIMSIILAAGGVIKLIKPIRTINSLDSLLSSDEVATSRNVLAKMTSDASHAAVLLLFAWLSMALGASSSGG